MFKLIGEAYEVLSNPETKLQYDRYGHQGVGNTHSTQEESFGNNPSWNRRESRRNRRDPFDDHRAFDIFNHFFAEMGTDPFSDPFFAGNRGGRGGDERQSTNRRRDPFSDPFFSDPFGGFGGFGHDPFGNFGGVSSSHFTSMSGNGSMMSGTSTSTTTVISGDGTRRTRKETTIIHPDGRKETNVEEFTNDTRNSSNRLSYQENPNPRITSDPRQNSNHRLYESGTRVLDSNAAHRSLPSRSSRLTPEPTHSRSRSGQRY
jgi:curved DNA-binding protein CbpA